MMIKLIGALMIVISCAGVGFQMAAAQRREEKLLDTLCGLMSYMECELQYQMTPLPALCRNTAKQTNGALQAVFLELARELESQISPDAQSCMFAALSKCKGIPHQVALCLQELGKTLGVFDIQGQLTGIDAVKQTCCLRLESLRRNKESRLRGYKTLGLCAGAAIVILFI